jgi:hypothetical protein
MRFVLAAFSVAAVAMIASSCSESVPAAADGAYFLTTIQNDPLKCMISGHTDQVGAIDAQERKTVLTDGVMNTKVSCTVLNAQAPFDVHAVLDDTANTGNYFEMLIPAISTSNKVDSPAAGNVIFSDVKTAGNAFSGNCNFYIEGKEGVAAGKIWVSFSCDEVSFGMSSCPLKQGYAIFENCLTEAIASE